MEKFRPSHQSDADGHESIVELIESYASEVALAATVDEAMAERLRLEIMDHLTEAAAMAGVEAGASRVDHAIARFGSISEIARDYRALIMESRSRSLRFILIAAILVVFAVMRLRGFILEPGWRDSLVSTGWGSLLLAIDRYAFAVALMIVMWRLVSERVRSRILLSSQWQTGVTARDFAMIVVAAVLILMSALAGIGSFLATFSAQKAGMALNGAETITVAALTTICITVLTGLFKLFRAYARVNDPASGQTDDMPRGVIP